MGQSEGVSTRQAPATADIQIGPQRVPRGATRTCKTWAAEAAMRMVMNNLEPESAEDPEHHVVYGGPGRAERDLKGPLRRFSEGCN